MIDKGMMTVTSFKFGLVHAPVTPFTRQTAIDFDALRQADRLPDRATAPKAWPLPMHVGESVNLSVDDRQALLEFAVKHVRGRVPVIAHVSESGTAIAASLAAHAQKAGAAAIDRHGALLLEAAAVDAARAFRRDRRERRRCRSSLQRARTRSAASRSRPIWCSSSSTGSPNFAGIVDASLDWQFMIEVISSARRVRPDFQLVSATEYMISARAIGATGLLSSLANIAPKLVRELYGHCRTERYLEARDHQTGLAILHRLIKPVGVPGVKAAMGVMGRDCGAPRAPLPTLAGEELRSLGEKLSAIPAIGAEPRGWG